MTTCKRCGNQYWCSCGVHGYDDQGIKTLEAALAEARKGLEFYEHELSHKGSHPRYGYLMSRSGDFYLHYDGCYYGGQVAEETLKKIDEILETNQNT